MSRVFWACLFGSLLCWALAVVNLVLWRTEGESLSLIRGLFCAGNAVWATVNTARVYVMDREWR